LLFGSVGHLTEQIVDLIGVVHNLMHAIASVAHDLGALGHFISAGGDEGLDLSSRCCTAPG